MILFRDYKQRVNIVSVLDNKRVVNNLDLELNLV